MEIYKTRNFSRWASKEGLLDERLRSAVGEIERGLIDADLGGSVIKKRVALLGRGKSAGSRTLLAFRKEDCAIFLYGFAKSERSNIDRAELEALQKWAAYQLQLTPQQLEDALSAGALIEVNHD